MSNVLNESIVDENNQNSCNVQQHSLRNNNVRKRHCSQNEPSMGSSTNDDDIKRSKTMSIGIPKDVVYYNKDKENQANTVRRSVNDKVKTKASKTTNVAIERPAKKREPTGYKTTGLDDHEDHEEGVLEVNPSIEWSTSIRISQEWISANPNATREQVLGFLEVFRGDIASIILRYSNFIPNLGQIPTTCHHVAAPQLLYSKIHS